MILILWSSLPLKRYVLDIQTANKQNKDFKGKSGILLNTFSKHALQNN